MAVDKKRKVRKPLQNNKFWSPDVRKIRDEYVRMLYNKDLFDRRTIIKLVEDRFNKQITLMTLSRIIKKFSL